MLDAEKSALKKKWGGGTNRKVHGIVMIFKNDYKMTAETSGGISLLSIAGNILSRIILSRFLEIDEQPEYQLGSDHNAAQSA